MSIFGGLLWSGTQTREHAMGGGSGQTNLGGLRGYQSQQHAALQQTQAFMPPIAPPRPKTALMALNEALNTMGTCGIHVDVLVVPKAAFASLENELSTLRGFYRTDMPPEPPPNRNQLTYFSRYGKVIIRAQDAPSDFNLDTYMETVNG